MVMGRAAWRWARCAVALPAVLLAGCAALPAPLSPDRPPPAATPQVCAVDGITAFAEQDKPLLGVNPDWAEYTLAEYAERAGRSPAVAVSFSDFPMTAVDRENVRGAADQVRESGALLLLTLEPRGGLTQATEDSADALAGFLAQLNTSGVGVLVRFAHEMNGSWYAWGQQPAAYTAAFRTVADAVHSRAPGTAMMWAPNYGGGYPFTGGAYAAAAGSADALALDTDGDGAVTGADDPYAPYYPGDDAVDWVGMSLYHWGSDHPWGENELPERGKFAAQLTGEYVGLGGDDSALPDFYGIYAEQHGKPLAIPETAALVVPRGENEGEGAIRRAWWAQVLSADTLSRFPKLRMVNWFEWRKHEPEVGDVVDWSVTADAGTAAEFRAHSSREWANAPVALPSCDTR